MRVTYLHFLGLLPERIVLLSTVQTECLSKIHTSIGVISPASPSMIEKVVVTIDTVAPVGNDYYDIHKQENIILYMYT